MTLQGAVPVPALYAPYLKVAHSPRLVSEDNPCKVLVQGGSDFIQMVIFPWPVNFKLEKLSY